MIKNEEMKKEEDTPIFFFIQTALTK